MITTMTLPKCEHKFGLKRRWDFGAFYCPVCRADVYEEINESTGQGGSDTNKLDGRRPLGDSSREGVQWRKL